MYTNNTSFRYFDRLTAHGLARPCSIGGIRGARGTGASLMGCRHHIG